MSIHPVGTLWGAEGGNGEDRSGGMRPNHFGLAGLGPGGRWLAGSAAPGEGVQHMMLEPWVWRVCGHGNRSA